MSGRAGQDKARQDRAGRQGERGTEYVSSKYSVLYRVTRSLTLYSVLDTARSVYLIETRTQRVKSVRNTKVLSGNLRYPLAVDQRLRYISNASLVFGRQGMT